MSVKVAALYSLVFVEEVNSTRDTILLICRSHNVFGALTIACEGINGTIAGEHGGIDSVVQAIKDTQIFGAFELKFSYAETNPFVRMKVLIRPEIVTMGIPAIEPGRGTYVSPKDWNALISDPEVVLLDTRNTYEVDLGTFKGAVNPATDSFKQFPGFVTSSFDPSKHKKIAMFCTGGIRCEKASTYMLTLGFENVYHLQGGILRYLEEVPEEESLWDGDCYVFDQRVAVGHGLVPSRYTQCRSCRIPLHLDRGDLEGEEYEEGVSCRHCFSSLSEEKKSASRERHLQIILAKKRKVAHLGTKVE